MLTLRQVTAVLDEAQGSGPRRYWPKNLAAKVSYGQFWGLASSIPVVRVGRAWRAREEDVQADVDLYTARQQELQQATADFRNHVIHDGRHRIDGGSYTAGPDFYHVVNDMAAALHESSGSTYCRRCHKPAGAEHTASPSAIRAPTGGGCSGDCTLSAVFCADCGTRVEYSTPAS